MKGTDAGWERFFKRGDALEQIEKRGYTYVTAKTLKEIAKWEPRLLAKQDTLEQRPAVFQKHSLAIFPVRNGEYILFRDEEQKSFYEFSREDLELNSTPYVSEVRLADFDSFPRNGLTNEMQALDFGYISSLLRTVTGETKLDLVLRGRTYSGEFDFVLPEVEHRVKVASVQIEVDGGYESPDSVYLIEAKLGRHPNFHIRQLYYPYLEWKHRSPKRVVPIFLIYTNARYYFYEFSFAEEFGAISVVRRLSYILDDAPVPVLSVDELVRNVREEPEPGTPFPQANDLDRVFDLLGIIADGGKTKFQLAEAFDFDERQGDYYGNAARYLGLASKKGGDFAITEAGRAVLAAAGPREKAELVIRRLVARPTFRRSLIRLAATGFSVDAVTDKAIAGIIGEETNLRGTTPPRRASTVRSWLTWMLRNGKWKQ